MNLQKILTLNKENQWNYIEYFLALKEFGFDPTNKLMLKAACACKDSGYSIEVARGLLGLDDDTFHKLDMLTVLPIPQELRLTCVDFYEFRTFAKSVGEKQLAKYSEFVKKKNHILMTIHGEKGNTIAAVCFILHTNKNEYFIS